MELGIYVHIPFCVRKCHYCDFNSGPVNDEMRKRYLQALELEIRNNPWRGSPARTLFLGGGTPSELLTQELASVVQALRESFALANDGEWSIECNPGTVTVESLREMRELGFNRISLGVQSFHDHHLEALGRIHDAADALEAYEWARQAGFDNVNLDLIFALPGQTPAEWKADLGQALRLFPEHLSLYNLTVEPNTEFGHRKTRGELQEIDEETSAVMYERAMDLTAAHGYEHYEISNYAQPGRQCAHNWIYWRNEPYLGFGISAASFMGGMRWSNTGNMNTYLQAAPSGRVPHASEEALRGRDALSEEIMLALRTREGISIPDLSARHGMRVDQLFRETFDFLKAQELLTEHNERVVLTRRGKMLANEVCVRFL